MNTLELRPAMPSQGTPDWPGARWIGSVDRAASAVADRIVLHESEQYDRARLLVKDAGAVLGFVDVTVTLGVVDLPELHAALSAFGDLEATQDTPSGGPRVTVVVCTRDRVEHLRTAMRAILDLDYHDFDVVVVDNASSTEETAEFIRDELADPRVSFLKEPVAGLARARNTGLLAATGEIIAFTDDDVVVDAAWLTRLVAAFRSAPNVGCVSGLVPSGELRTRVQGYFDDRVSWSKNLQRRQYSLAEPPADLPMFPFSVGAFGTGANFALTRRVALELGGFDPALGVGTPTGGGEDIDMFARVILDGRTLVVDPSAIVWHRHRDDLAALRTQARGYGTGLGAWLTKVMLTPSTAGLALRRGGSGVLRLVSLASTSAAAPEERASRASTPEELAWSREAAAVGRLELRSVLVGPIRYLAQGRRHSGISTDDASSLGSLEAVAR